MYVNCELKAHTKGSEHCIGCHSRGCHVTDTNTLLMIGRPNYSPHFHCTKFDSGDIAFWEKYLSANDVETLCGAPTGELHYFLARKPSKKRKKCSHHILSLVDTVTKEIKRDSGTVNFIVV